MTEDTANVIAANPSLPPKNKGSTATDYVVDVSRITHYYQSPAKRTVSADLGLMSKEQLLANYTGGSGQFMPEDATWASKVKALLASLRRKLDSLLDNGSISITYSDATVIVIAFVVFGDDVRLLFFPPKADIAFAVLYSIAFLLFVIELPLRCWVRSDFSKGVKKVEGYFLSFYFWLDLCAVIAMIPVLPWLSPRLGMYQGAVWTRREVLLRRNCHILRLVRIVGLYNSNLLSMKDDKIIGDLETLAETDESLEKEEIKKYLETKRNQQKRSQVGAQLSDIITRKVIIAVLLIVFIVPLLSYSSINQDESKATALLESINENAGGINDTSHCDYLLEASTAFEHFFNIDEHHFLLGLEIFPPRCNSTHLINFYNDDFIRQLRPEAMVMVSTPKVIIDGREYFTIAVFNLQHELQRICRSNIYLALFVIFVLRALSFLFNKDARELVLSPIEEMVQMVNRVASDPLAESTFEKNEASKDPHEIQVVRLAIQKITSLLRVGFGVAGAAIISSNMNVEGVEGTILKPMVPGRRIYAIFGFCDIHSFDLYTEKLEDEIMAFVNSIARIVHEEVTRWGGLCNKNLGNAFLMVWRIGDEEGLQITVGKSRRKSGGRATGNTKRHRNTFAELDLKRMPGLDTLSDKALIGFLKVIVEINRDRQVLSYRRNKRLLAGRKDGCTVRMGFGLNAGWAIEGAVGSLQKVDATYLSPHVNMAARMEAASRQFGLAILMTERFHELLSPEAQEHCRKVDVVTVKGSNIPMPIYTYETLQSQEFPALQVPKFSGLDLKSVLSQQALNYTPLDWTQDPDLIQLRRLSTHAFRSSYEQGLRCYLSGQWKEAREHFESADLMMSGNDLGYDGPSRVLLQYMKVREWVCPEGWKGCRPLASK